MSKRISASSWRIVGVGLTMLMMGVLLLTNVSLAHASSLRNATARYEHVCTTSDDTEAYPTDGVQVGDTHDVKGIYDLDGYNHGLWATIGFISLMQSPTCGTWALFNLSYKLPLEHPNVRIMSLAVYLYSKGGGWLQEYCTPSAETCKTGILPLGLGTIPAQAVASATMTTFF